MSSSLVQVTLREVQATIGSWRFWCGLLCVVAVLTVSGPFDTANDFTAPQRFIYWLGVSVSTYFLALAVLVPVVGFLRAKGWRDVVTYLVGGLAAGPPVGALVYLINTVIADNDSGGMDDVIRLLVLCTLISVPVCFLHLVVEDVAQDRADAPEQKPPKRAPLLDRLPPEKRGSFLSLNAQDHYVEVVTTRGRELVLVRMADAIAQLGDVDGLRVHRSWWVARAAVASVERRSGRTVLHLSDGQEVPVSRANEKAVRDWGI